MSRYIFLILLMISCQTPDISKNSTLKKKNQVREFISREDDRSKIEIPSMEMILPTIYPWEKGNSLPKITKEYFRCKGSSLSPVRSEWVGGEVIKYLDCGGSEKHSLPLKDGKEFIYPILIDLLNYVQEKTKKRLVITSGHRCPEHNTYVDPSRLNQYSKHQVGAEVDFYVQGMESHPEAILDILFSYYKMHPDYNNNKEYVEFTRYEKNDAYVITPPWMNKEIFIKVYKANEGRNLDNRHPYPYISIQVRYDSMTNKRVSYSWDQAFSNFLRY